MRNTVFILYARNRLEDAVALMRRAVELDPLSGALHCFLAGSYRIAARLDEAETAIQKSLELSPRSGFAHFYQSDIYLAQGRLDEALEAAKREINGVFRMLALANVYHAQRRHTEANAALDELIQTYKDTGALQIAEALAYRGERDRAFTWLERACLQRDPGMSMVRVLPNLRGLHDDPRWKPLLERVGLVD
jgi:tetratricopeptide (TPR) repeat protein